MGLTKRLANSVIQKRWILSLCFVLGIALGLRIWNLGYSSFFSDEALYVLVGKLGVFQGDWTTYSPQRWFPGLIYLYPSISAIAYSFAGVWGARLISVVCGMVAVVAVGGVAYSLAGGDKTRRRIAATVSMIIVGTNSSALYMSRIATYDMPAYSLFWVSVFATIVATSGKHGYGKWYFIASIALVSSVLFNGVVLIYVPALTLISWWFAKKTDMVKFWRGYFVFPVLAGIALFVVSKWWDLRTLIAAQNLFNADTLKSQVVTYWDLSKLSWVLWLVGSVGLILSKRIKLWLLFTLAGVTVLGTGTMDKHVFFTASYLSIVIGVGVAYFIINSKDRYARSVNIFLVMALLVMFVSESIYGLRYYNELWLNTTTGQEALSSLVKKGDVVLAESGPVMTLKVYESTNSLDTVTFDWFVYRKKTDLEAYKSAVADGHFDVIELLDPNLPKDELHQTISNAVWAEVWTNYHLAFSAQGQYIFRRDF